MTKCWRTILAAVLLAGTGCTHLCPCCDWCGRDDRPLLEEGPPTGQLPPGTVPPVGPAPGSGAYGGTGP